MHGPLFRGHVRSRTRYLCCVESGWGRETCHCVLYAHVQNTPIRHASTLAHVLAVPWHVSREETCAKALRGHMSMWFVIMMHNTLICSMSARLMSYMEFLIAGLIDPRNSSYVIVERLLAIAYVVYCFALHAYASHACGLIYNPHMCKAKTNEFVNAHYARPQPGLEPVTSATNHG